MSKYFHDRLLFTLLWCIVSWEEHDNLKLWLPTWGLQDKSEGLKKLLLISSDFPLIFYLFLVDYFLSFFRIQQLNWSQLVDLASVNTWNLTLYLQWPTWLAENDSMVDPSNLSYSVKNQMVLVRIWPNQEKNAFHKMPLSYVETDRASHCRRRYCEHEQNEITRMMVVK